MKNWILVIIIILFVTIAGMSVYGYQTIREPLKHNYEQAERYVLGQSLLQSVSDISYYHGTDAYYVFEGTSVDDEEVIIWVSEEFDSHQMAKVNEGISVDEAVAIVKKQDEIKRIQSVKLGFERGLPIYEIVYVNNENRKGYYYVTFEDGIFMKRYVLRTD
ncbi:DUF5590 domain-containing protein [Halalkalibacter kiskunsagensis]|uniref:DUF5590 domain-containing protein n=1 Tax=Halalkalibacter kiskunsagensis TaxID=1548599 RepID=A0ABV6KAA9_9BACI